MLTKMICLIILLLNLMFPVNGNVFDVLPEQPCDFLVIGMFSLYPFGGEQCVVFLILIMIIGIIIII